MKKTPIHIEPDLFPEVFRPLLEGTEVFDSSCSREARVYYLPKEGGCYLKVAEPGTLEREAALNRYFFTKGLGPEVLEYRQAEKDYLLTRAVPGEDCIHSQYLDDPKRLCETTALLLRQLHETDYTGCPVPDRRQTYLETVRTNYCQKQYDVSLFPDNWGYRTPEEAWAVVEEFSPQLQADTLLHGDYCLPNILLQDWKFSGFIDLGCGGVGDRHIDLFWGSWTLLFNLKTDAWCDRFLDAYGRDRIEPALLRAIAAFEVFA